MAVYRFDQETLNNNTHTNQGSDCTNVRTDPLHQAKQPQSVMWCTA